MDLIPFILLIMFAGGIQSCRETDCHECVTQPGCVFIVQENSNSGNCVSKIYSNTLDDLQSRATSKRQCIVINKLIKVLVEKAQRVADIYVARRQTTTTQQTGYSFKGGIKQHHSLPTSRATALLQENVPTTSERNTASTAQPPIIPKTSTISPITSTMNAVATVTESNILWKQTTTQHQFDYSFKRGIKQHHSLPTSQATALLQENVPTTTERDITSTIQPRIIPSTSTISPITSTMNAVADVTESSILWKQTTTPRQFDYSFKRGIKQQSSIPTLRATALLQENVPTTTERNTVSTTQPSIIPSTSTILPITSTMNAVAGVTESNILWKQTTTPHEFDYSFKRGIKQHQHQK